MKWSKWTVLIFVAIAAVFVGTAAVLAEPLQQAITDAIGLFSASGNITITSTPMFGLQVPTNIQVTYVNDSDLDVSWEMGNAAVNTMIVANYNHYPISPEDGYVLYDGPATNINDTSVNINEYWGNYYVSAWSQGNDGAWTTDYSSAEYGVDMTALVGVLTEWAFLFIWVTLMILSHVMHDIFIKLMVVPVSVVLGAYIMGLGNTAINKGFGIVIIIIGVYFLLDSGADFLRNRNKGR